MKTKSRGRHTLLMRSLQSNTRESVRSSGYTVKPENYKKTKSMTVYLVLAGMVDTGQVHTQDSQNVALCWISQVLIKAEPTGWAYIHPDILGSMYLPHVCDQTHPGQLRQPAVCRWGL